MKRTEAIEILSRKALNELSPEQRDERLYIMTMEAWDDSPGWKKLKWSVRREFRKGELKHPPTDARYDDVLLIALTHEFNAYSNDFLSKQLSSNVTGLEPDLFACPCCGYRTLDEQGVYDICRICWWEDDGQDNKDADKSVGGPNDSLSLTQARINYLKFGIYNPERTDLLKQKDDTSKYLKGRTFQLDGKNRITELD